MVGFSNYSLYLAFVQPFLLVGSGIVFDTDFLRECNALVLIGRGFTLSDSRGQESEWFSAKKYLDA